MLRRELVVCGRDEGDDVHQCECGRHREAGDHVGERSVERIVDVGAQVEAVHV